MIPAFNKLRRWSMLLIVCLSGIVVHAQEIDDYSIAGQWMKTALNAIRHDGQGPTIHSRNMFHAGTAMYDAWAFYEEDANTYFLGKKIGNYRCELKDFDIPKMNMDSAQEVAIAYAAFRILETRFSIYGSKNRVLESFVDLFEKQGFDRSFRSVDYTTGSPAALGNYIAGQLVAFGRQDGSNEDDQHESFYYSSVNPPLRPAMPGNPTMKDPNRWQPITVQNYVEKKGLDMTLPGWNYLFVNNQDVFLTPEWGNVIPFALTEDDLTVHERDGKYLVYLDPGPPPLISENSDDVSSEQFKYGFCINAIWSGLVDPSDSVRIDISPGALGTQPPLPKDISEFADFYDLFNGGVMNSIPYKENPSTGKPYESNLVLRGDYVRVIAEYWVDAINTHGPPGHWLDHLIMVSYDPAFKRRWRGKGPELDSLEWDVKSFFAMTGAMHDAGISCWGIKGYYDYVRPISAIRYMAGKGQSSDKNLAHYHPRGIPLYKGHIELVLVDDPLVGSDKENLYKIKLWAWKGPDSVANAFTDVAGVGWILAENWWPYQRYSFVTPAFAGYTSGHSTFSPAGAEILTEISGNPFFPGGMHTFTAKAHEFLEFEDGPTEDITLQWATYHDAAAETCLSRIYGGIHPPCDDIPARKIGIEIARKAVLKAEEYFNQKN